MSRIAEERPFLPMRIAVLAVSDTRSLAEDKSGDLLVARHRGFLEFIWKSLVLLVFFDCLHTLLVVLLWASHVLVISLVGQGPVIFCAFFVTIQLL